ncbi:MAG: peptidase MA family metallohydrolase [Bacteroidota bacterium]
MRPHRLLVLFVLALGPSLMLAQGVYFGKNKVQYNNFTWYYLQSAHFDVYFADGGEYLAEFTAEAAESAYVSISKTFRHQLANRVPIVVYNSHNEFQQTNVVGPFLEEGIGGVTELFKNRVVIPFEGDYRKFRHVIHHELVHAIINDMFYGGSLQSIITNNITLQLPLWFNEGLAEYEALQWDTDSDMFIRDATIHEYLPPINRLSGYFAYRGGQSVWWYIANKYGEQKIGEILSRIKATRNVEMGFRAALGIGTRELSDRWVKEQKVIYWPDIAKREDPSDYARRLTDHTKIGNFYNTSPVISPQGDKIAFISDRDDYFDVFIMSGIDGAIRKKLVKGNRTADFEELHLLTPGITWSPDGKKIALAVKSGSRDAIFAIDVRSGDRDKYEFDQLSGIFSVDWSPSGDRLAFVGIQGAQSDIYVFDVSTKALANLTGDLFTDGDPTWSSDGTTIYFASDRGRYLDGSEVPSRFKMHTYDFSQRDIYSVSVETRRIERIINAPDSDESSPLAVPDGKHLFYISDKNGINNIYVRDLDGDSDRPITNSLSGVYQLSISKDGNKLVFASLSKAGFDVFLMKTPLERRLDLVDLEWTEFFKMKQKYELEAEEPAVAGHLDSGSLENRAMVLGEKVDTTKLYGENIAIDFRSYVFTEDFGDKEEKKKIDEPSELKSVAITDNLDEEGNYKVHKYKLNFSPDIIYGNAAYSTFYGVTGSTIMAFSDMLGDHQIFLLTNLLLDLRNSDYGVFYTYLPNRIDWSVQGFHSARFILLGDEFGRGSVYRFRTYGLSLGASYPINKFKRVDLGLSWFNLTREDLDPPFDPTDRRTVFLGSLAYVHDTILWGYTSPNNGQRYRFDVYGSPKLSKSTLGFVNVTGDIRKYYKFWRDYTFAIRFSGGASFGPDPQRFIIGGVDQWINRTFEDNRVPLDNAGDFVFLQAGLPLRGYNYNAGIGTKYALANLELRYPLFGYLVAGPLPLFFQSLTGVAFLDVGAAWRDAKAWKAFTSNNIPQDLLVGTGFGARVFFLIGLIRFDVAWAYNSSSSRNISGWSSPHYYISLGTDF